MSRSGPLVVAIALLALQAPAAYGGDAKRFSVSLSAGVRPDMADLGSTIALDGTLDTADNTVANAIYSTDKGLMSDQDNMTIAYNSGDTDSVLAPLADFELGGPMLGIEIGGDIRYEFDDVIKFPLFFQGGFYYSTRMSGGQQSRTHGTITEDVVDLLLLFGANGENVGDYSGGTMVSNYDASWFEIPLSLGVKIPFPDNPNSYVYGKAGLSIFSGGFSVAIDVDAQYANTLTTYIDADEATVHNYSPGPVSDEIAFTTTAVGLNYGIGAQAAIGKSGLAVFVELNSSGASETVLSQGLKPQTKQLLTAMSSETLAQTDPEWFDQLAFPVVFGGATARIGVRYFIF